MIQLLCLNYILDKKDKAFIIDNGLNDTFFSEYKGEFNFIKQHIDTYGYVPDTTTILSHFRDFQVVKVSEKEDYLLNELYKDRNKREIASAFNKVATLVNEDKVDEALSVWTKAYDKISKQKRLNCVDLVKDTSRYNDYVERINDYRKYYVTTGFKELDEIIGGWDRKEDIVTVSGRLGQGKCLAKGTKVLMADGTTKNVEDVVVGDKVQSLDRVNTVLGLHNGTSHGYKIIPNIGEPFVVSENHILTILKLKEFKKKENGHGFTNGTYDLIDVSIEDYLSWSKHKQSRARLYRPAIDYNTKEQLIDPYILGVWLGDGTAREPEITTADGEIVEELSNFAKNVGLKCIKHEDIGSKSDRYSIVGKKKHKSPFLEALRYYNLINNKHIPLNYLTGDRNQRLELLAGLIDTNGHLDRCGTVDIVQKSLTLLEQIAQLARGLGIKVGRIREKYVKQYNKTYYRVSLSGNLSQIPNRIKYKHIDHNKGRQVDKVVTGFTVEPIDVVEYYGFMCDGDSRYLLSDNTLTHNTWLLLKIALAAAQDGLNVGIYSGEMSDKKIGYRLDTLVSHISNGAIIHGNSVVQDDYRTFLNEISKHIDGSIKVLTPEMIGDFATISTLSAFIEKENLDMLCVDQYSLLIDEKRGRTPTEQMANLSKDMRKLQKLKQIPIITAAQQNREEVVEGEETKNIGGSDRIGQDSTIVLMFEQKDGILTLKLVKSRDSGGEQKLRYVINLDKGLFTYLPNEEDALGGASSDDLRDEYEYSDGDNPF